MDLMQQRGPSTSRGRPPAPLRPWRSDPAGCFLLGLGFRSQEQQVGRSDFLNLSTSICADMTCSVSYNGNVSEPGCCVTSPRRPAACPGPLLIWAQPRQCCPCRLSPHPLQNQCDRVPMRQGSHPAGRPSDVTDQKKKRTRDVDLNPKAFLSK